MINFIAKEMEEGRIKIALVDDHTLFRTGLKGLLSQREDFTVVADVGSGEEFLAILPTLDVDVVFMDISMPGMDGSIGENTTLMGAENLLRCNDVEVVVLNDMRCRDLFLKFVCNNSEIWDSELAKVGNTTEVK